MNHSQTAGKQRERVMREDDFLVSKTDLKGRITYGNRIFIEFSGYSEAELLGAQHNIVRHPDMPRGVFKFLWDTLQAKQECFAYVKNRSKDGGFYWVFANVTPSYAADGKVDGYFLPGVFRHNSWQIHQVVWRRRSPPQGISGFPLTIIRRKSYYTRFSKRCKEAFAALSSHKIYYFCGGLLAIKLIRPVKPSGGQLSGIFPIA